jgi:TIGR03009 family protein
MRHIIAFFMLLASAADSCTSVPNTPSTSPKPPFQLTHEEQQNVDRLLARWEHWNAGVKTFDCRFKRWAYDGVFGQPNEPRLVELGSIKYAAPDRCLFRVDTAEENGKEVPIADSRAEQWSFDGKSLTEWRYPMRQIIEHKLPAGFQADRFVNGPLTFPYPLVGSLLFGSRSFEPTGPMPFSAKAEDLKRQYYIRKTDSPAELKDQICLEAYPRTAAVAAWHQRIQLIFRASDMSPLAMNIIQPNGKDRIVYQFFNAAVNAPPTPSADDPFHAPIPKGWQKIVENASASK